MSIKPNDSGLMDGHRGVCNESGDEHPNHNGTSRQLGTGDVSPDQQKQTSPVTKPTIPPIELATPSSTPNRRKGNWSSHF